MEFRLYNPSDAPAIETLFVSVFTRAEGEREGKLIGNLAGELMAHTARKDLYGFVPVDDGRIVGAIFFSRLSFKEESKAFILSPVAIHTDLQGKGIGRKLINHGLMEMKNIGASFVVTYGDPAFYTKVGFCPLSQDVIAPPFELSQPQGWLGQSLTGQIIKPVSGRASCVAALQNPVYW